VIHISTPGVTGLVAGAWEYLPFDPPDEYERTKGEGEKILREAIPDRWLVILRPDFVYGPGDRHKLALWKQIAKGWIPLVGRGGAMIRPTYVDDVGRAIAEALPGGNLNRGSLYNIGGPRPVSVRYLYETISNSMGADRLRMITVPPLLLRLVLLLGPLAPSGLTRSRLRLLGHSHYVLTGKAWQAGFRPQVELDDGIRKTTAWYREQGLV
jgi:nucleoside-diphosphate-sugar epimerase